MMRHLTWPPACNLLKRDLGGVLSKMAEGTIKDSKERGIRVCEKGNQLFRVFECTGSKCGVLISGKCPPNSVHFSDIHTHPSGEPMSHADVSIAANALEDRVCVIMGRTLQCLEEIHNLNFPQNIKKYNDFAYSNIPCKVEDFYPKYERLLKRLGVRFCEVEL